MQAQSCAKVKHIALSCLIEPTCLVHNVLAASLSSASSPLTAPLMAGPSCRRFFYLVQMLQQAAKAAGEVRVRWLEQQADGLYHPSSKEWDEPFGALSKVRTQKCSAKKGGHLCYKLLTLRSKIEAVELED